MTTGRINQVSRFAVQKEERRKPEPLIIFFFFPKTKLKFRLRELTRPFFFSSKSWYLMMKWKGGTKVSHCLARRNWFAKAKDKISEKRSLFTALWKKKSFSLWEIMISIGCGTRKYTTRFLISRKSEFPISQTFALVAHQCHQTVHDSQEKTRKEFHDLASPVRGLFDNYWNAYSLWSRESIQSSKQEDWKALALCVLSLAKIQKTDFDQICKDGISQGWFPKLWLPRFRVLQHENTRELPETPRSRRAGDTSDWRLPDSSNNWNCYHEDAKPYKRISHSRTVILGLFRRRQTKIRFGLFVVVTTSMKHVTTRGRARRPRHDCHCVKHSTTTSEGSLLCSTSDLKMGSGLLTSQVSMVPDEYSGNFVTMLVFIKIIL